MTRPMSDSTPTEVDTTAVIAAAARRRPKNLTHEVVAQIKQRIQDKSLKPGDKLPTEAEIMRAFAVSRTVVREALSRLQAAGWVETHHGIGTFVVEARPASLFGTEQTGVGAPIDVLAMLELRIALETESAGLAAVRRSDDQLRAMRAALDDFAAHVEEAGDTVTPDFRFHHEIARATGNPYFSDIMSHLGTTIIPRTRISSAMRVAPALRAQHLQRVNREHEEIYDAIARQDPESARAAMRLHLTNSRERLKRASAEGGPSTF